jgi:hypothetical protein
MKRTTLQKLSKKLNLNEKVIKDMVYREHEYTKLVNKKTLCEVDLELKGDSYTILRKIARTLKISIDAVICSILIEQMSKKDVDTKTK